MRLCRSRLSQRLEVNARPLFRALPDYGQSARGHAHLLALSAKHHFQQQRLCAQPLVCDSYPDPQRKRSLLLAVTNVRDLQPAAVQSAPPSTAHKKGILLAQGLLPVIGRSL